MVDIKILVLVYYIHSNLFTSVESPAPTQPPCREDCEDGITFFETQDIGFINRSAVQRFNNTTCKLSRYSECEKEFVGRNQSAALCTDDQVSIELEPYFVEEYPAGNITRFNVSLSPLRTDVKSVHVFISCPIDAHDEYCRTLEQRGKVPCVFVDLSSISDLGKIYSQIHLPIKCFGSFLTDTVLDVRVILYVIQDVKTTACENRFRILIPHHFALHTRNVMEWKPALYADFKDPEGVYLRTNLPKPGLGFEGIHFELTSLNETLNRAQTVRLPSTGYLFKNLKRGWYVAKAYGMNRFCPEANKICYHQVSILEIHVPEDRFARNYIILQHVKMYSPVVAGAILGVALTSFVLMAVYLYCRRKKRSPTRTVVQFTQRPKVLILYTDDHVPHRRTVMTLATYLKTVANCDVLLDEWVLRQPRTSPVDWLIRSVASADFFILVFSLGGKCYFDGSSKELIPERPWTELFGLGLQKLFNRILSDDRSIGGNIRQSLAHYACVMFEYSASTGCVPDIFASFASPQFVIMRDLRRLICHIHGVPYNNVEQNEPLHATELEDAIKQARCYELEHPDWLTSRLRSTVEIERIGLDDITARLVARIESEEDGSSANGHATELTEFVDTRRVDTVRYPLLDPARVELKPQNANLSRFPLL